MILVYLYGNPQIFLLNITLAKGLGFVKSCYNHA